MTRTGIVRELNNLKNSEILKIYRDNPAVKVYYFFDNDCGYRKIARIHIYKTDPVCFRITFNVPEKNYFHDIFVRYNNFTCISDFRKWLKSTIQKYLYN